MNYNTAILQLICPDRPGLVSEISGWVAKNGGNIRHADHHTDDEASLFLSRIEWDLNGFGIDRLSIPKQVSILADKVSGQAQINFSDEIPRVAILVSKQSHCLVDLLLRARNAELPMEIPLIISNHRDLEPLCSNFGIEFKYVPMEPKNKSEAENIILDLIIRSSFDSCIIEPLSPILSFLKLINNIFNSLYCVTLLRLLYPNKFLI